MSGAALTDGYGIRRALPWRALTARQQGMWLLLHAGCRRIEVLATEPLLAALHYTPESIERGLRLLAIVGWAEQRGDDWHALSPEHVP